MNQKKKKLRTLALIAIAVAAIVGIVLRFKIEPADYGRVLAKEITRAEKLLDQAVPGNDNGEYSDYVIGEFRSEIDTARQTADREDSFYDEEKAAYEQLKEAADTFKKSANADSLSKKEVQELIDSGSTTEKTITFSKWNRLVWKLDGSKLKKAEAVNLHVETKGPYYAAMCKTMEKYQMQALVLAFYQNGAYPGELTVTADTSLKKGTVYLYQYEEEKDTFVYQKDLKTDGETVSFALKTPGTYAILGDTYENYVAAGEVADEDLATEIVAEETETLTEADTEESGTETTETELSSTERKTEAAAQTDASVAAGGDADKEHTQEASTSDSKKKDTGKKNNPAGGNTTDKKDTKKDNTTDADSSKEDTKKPQTPVKPSTEKPSTEKPSTEKPQTPAKPSTEKPQTPTETPSQDDGMIECTIQILCTTLSSDPSKLTNQGVRDYIPANGVILDTTTLQIPEGESVYYALRTATRNHNIQMEAEYTPLYSGNYVKGIGYLYEFDAGGESGWMYKVNGRFPNYGCSAYTVNDGDEIVWMYTCDLGKDVGDNSMQ